MKDKKQIGLLTEVINASFKREYSTQEKDSSKNNLLIYLSGFKLVDEVLPVLNKFFCPFPSEKFADL